MYGPPPPSSQPGSGAAYPPPPPSYGVDATKPLGAGAVYPPQPVQPAGVGVAYTTQPQAVIGVAAPAVVVAPAPTTVMVGTTFADTPASCTCPVCRQQIVSRIEYKNGLLVWALFGTLLFLGCWLGCCLIPFCMDSCKDVDHYCPSCNHHLSKYKKL